MLRKDAMMLKAIASTIQYIIALVLCNYLPIFITNETLVHIMSSYYVGGGGGAWGGEGEK